MLFTTFQTMNLLASVLLKSLLAISLSLNFGHAIAQTEINPNSLDKIKFDLEAISRDGLRGNGDSLRSLTYEFCIPNQTEFLEEVTQIDPNIQFYPQSRGRVGCQSDQVLALGDTHNANWKEILFNLAQLDYIKTIEEFYGE